MLTEFIDSSRLDINYFYRYGDMKGLMENAGAAVAESVSEFYGNKLNIIVVCGSGNNGGDGIVAARILQKENNVALVLTSDIDHIKSAFIKNLISEWKGKISGIQDIDSSLSNADLIIDAIFGTGFHGEIREPLASIIKKINSSGKPVLSVDVPSGIGSSFAIKPSKTVTFTFVKDSMDKQNSGDIITKNIGIDQKSVYETGPGDILFFPSAEKSSHKGINGKLAIVAGWKYHGSALIASMGAHSTSPDLARIFINSRNYSVIGSQIHTTMLENCEENEYFMEEILKYDSILMGPGMGNSDYEISVMEKIMEAANVPIVLDASAINIIGKQGKGSMGKEIVITPHKGEFQKLTGTEPTLENAKSAAKKFGITIFLKGPTDIITDGVTTILGNGGNSRMTMGGTGDLLAGLLAGLISRKVPTLRACSMASFINKRAAERCVNHRKVWFGIDEMVNEIPQVFMEMEEVRSKIKEM